MKKSFFFGLLLMAVFSISVNVLGAGTEVPGNLYVGELTVNRSVAVGASVPAAYELDVIGDAYITGAFYDSGGDAGNPGEVLSVAEGGGTDWIAAPACITCGGTLNGTRWCDNGDGTVTDMTSGLVWLKDASWGGKKPWRSNKVDPYDDAHYRAGILYAGMAGAGLSDGSTVGHWRLPTGSELFNLANGTEQVRSDTQRAFTGVQSDKYWSSTSGADTPGCAWFVHLGNGDVSCSNKTNYKYVWPVRGGQ